MFVPGSDGTPGPVLGSGHETGPDRVREDILERGAQVVFVVDDPRREACGEKRAAAAVAGIVLSCIVALEPLGRVRKVFRSCLDDRVVVRPHQAVAMEIDHEALRGPTEKRKEHASILRVTEQHRFVDAPSSHVEVAVGQLRSEDARHRVQARGGAGLRGSPTHFLSTSDTPARANGECQTLFVAGQSLA